MKTLEISFKWLATASFGSSFARSKIFYCDNIQYAKNCCDPDF